ncbi:MAG: peptide antibiotic transporter SbmA [Vibrio sp.]
MFSAFFIKPRWLFGSAILWCLLCMLAWYSFVRGLGPSLSLGQWFGYGFPSALPNAAGKAVQHSYQLALEQASDVWLSQYLIGCFGLFMSGWILLTNHPWSKWSVGGSGVIISIVWFQVEVSVRLNDWYGDFYNLIQTALGHPNSIKLSQFYNELMTVGILLMTSILVSVLNAFFVSHYVFRWRTALTEYYTSKWQTVRHIEGASQRIQEDTMRFANIMENLGVSLLNAIMTLIAFLPILWHLSAKVTTLPLVGHVSQGLVFVSIIWSIIGTCLLGVAGIKLPGLEFKNQKVEAAYRKELVYGEDNAQRGQPTTLKALFSDVRFSYFRLYLHYVYFNVVRYGYLQFGNFIPLIILAPSIVAGAFTLGVMQRIMNAFGKVENSFQYLVNSWTTIVEMLSIYKRLKAFEQAIYHETLDYLEFENIED